MNVLGRRVVLVFWVWLVPVVAGAQVNPPSGGATGPGGVPWGSTVPSSCWTLHYDGSTWDSTGAVCVDSAAPANSLCVEATTGDVGVGTCSADHGVHVVATEVCFEGTDTAGACTNGLIWSSSQLVLVLKDSSGNLGFRSQGDGDWEFEVDTIGDRFVFVFDESNQWQVESAQFYMSGGTPNKPRLQQISPMFSEHGDADTGFAIDAPDEPSVKAGGVYVMKFQAAASAVNYLEVTPAAAGSDPVLSSAGSDTDIDVVVTPKGSGALNALGCRFFGKLSTAPSGAECDSYWDIDLNLICYHDGANWLQADDWSTFCT